MAVSLFESERLTLDDAIDLTAQSLRAYLPNYRQVAIAFSGGKDSTSALTVLLRLIALGEVPAPERLFVLVVPGTPENAATFLLAHSRRLIDRQLWPCLVTYADEWRGHTGAIYQADNWRYMGKTKPESVYTLNGRMVARKAGPHTRTKAEMLAMGAVLVGRFVKHKYVRVGR